MAMATAMDTGTASRPVPSSPARNRHSSCTGAPCGFSRAARGGWSADCRPSRSWRCSPGCGCRRRTTRRRSCCVWPTRAASSPAASSKRPKNRSARPKTCCRRSRCCAATRSPRRSSPAPGRRLQPKCGGFAPTLLTAVRVDSDAPADTLQLEFQATGYTVKNRAGLTVNGTYDTPLRIGGVGFTITGQPEVHSTRWVVVPTEAAVDRFIAQIKTARRPGTNIVDVSYTARQPALAQSVVNVLGTVFQNLEATSAQNQSKRRRIFLDEQLRRTDSLLAEAQQALSAFRSHQEAYSSRDKMASQQVALLDLETRRIALDANRDSYKSALSQLEQGDSTVRRAALRALAGNVELAANPVVVSLYTQLVSQQRALDSLRQIAPEQNPDVRRLAQLAAGTDNDLKAARPSHAATLDQQATALGTQTSRVAQGVRELPTVEAQEVRLVQQVETIKSLGNQLREERQRAAMAEAIAVGEVEIVDAARLPYKPVQTFASLKLLLALIFGVGSGVGLAMVRERWDLSIRNPEEMVEQLQ